MSLSATLSTLSSPSASAFPPLPLVDPLPMPLKVKLASAPPFQPWNLILLPFSALEPPSLSVALAAVERLFLARLCECAAASATAAELVFVDGGAEDAVEVKGEDVWQVYVWPRVLAIHSGRAAPAAKFLVRPVLKA